MGLRRPVQATGAAIIVTLACAEPAGAHGIGGRSDLPLPWWQVAYGAAIVLVVSFVALGRLWPQPRLARGRPPQPSHDGAAGAWRGPALAVRAVGVAALALVWAAAAFGSTFASENLAPVAV